MNSKTPLKEKEAIKIRVLLVEDQEDDALLLLTLLKRAGYAVSHERVDTVPGLNKALLHHWDIILSDHSMPTMNGMDVLKKVRQCDEDTPFIFVSGTIGEDVAVNAMRLGAQDYIMKGNLKRLTPAVERELQEAKTRVERRKAEKRLHYLTHYDTLTELPNRFLFLEKLKQKIGTHIGSKKRIGVFHIDLDRFKNINDCLGYDAGNLVLSDVAKRLKTCLDESGIVARLAADEFAILIDCCSNLEDLETITRSMSQALEKPYTIYGCSLYLSSSIGIAVFPDHATSAPELLRLADIAAYRVKGDGGKGYRFYEATMVVRLEDRLALERSMRSGLKKGEFSLYYQPQIDVRSQTMVGVEALLRWCRPEEGVVSPGEFIPLAEETGFIIPLGEWVVCEACQQIKRWEAAGLGFLTVAVNVSARQFHQENLPALLKENLVRYQVAPHKLKVEVTESVIVEDVEKACNTINQVQHLGVEVALDDFGTGYSSLSYLKDFRVDYLKIDQSFVRELQRDGSCKPIVSAIIALAKQLSMRTIAEGVEEQEQAEVLRFLGCDIVQGYLFGKPVSADNIPGCFPQSRQSNSNK